MGLAKAGGRLGPAEYLLDALAHPPTDRIAGVAGGPPVDCRPPVRGVLRHMRRHIVVPQIGHNPGHVVSLVCTERDPMIAGTRRHHLEPRLPLCRAGCQGQTRVDHQSVPVLHQNVPQIRQLGRLTWPPAFARAGSLRYNRALGSVIEACVSLLRFSPWKSRAPLRPGAGGSPLPSFGRKLFMLAHASISVPSTEKWSSDSNVLTRSWLSTAAMNCAAMSPAISRSRFLVNTVTSHTAASCDSPTNQRNNRL